MSLAERKIAFLICDVQERFRTLIPEFQDIVNVASRLVYIGHLFKFPIIVTEQNPNKLGKTVPEIHDLFTSKEKDKLFSHSNLSPPSLASPNSSLASSEKLFSFSKMKFSMFTDQVIKVIQDNNIRIVVLCGLESHVCILQTALEAIKNHNLQVWLMCDGIGSRFSIDKDAAIKRMQSEGVIMSTSEAFLYQLMESADHPMFRSIVELLKRT